MKTNNTFFGSFTQDADELQEKEVPEVKELETEEEKDDNLDTDSSDNDSRDKDEESDEVDNKEEKEESNDDEEFFTTIINDGAEKGLFYYDPDKEYEGEPEDIFWEVQTDTLNKRWEDEYVAGIPEEYQSLFTALKAGKSVTEWYENTQPLDYDKIDLADEKTQRELIKDHLESTGMDEEDVTDKLQEYEDAGTLEKNSKLAVKYFKKQDSGKAELYEKEVEREQKEFEDRQAKEFEKFKTQVLTTEKLGKRDLDKKERERLLDHITKPVNKRGESQFVINQKSLDKQLQAAYLDMIGFDFSKLEKEATTKAASGLRAKLSKTTDINGKSQGSRGKVEIESKKVGNWNPW